MSDLPELGEDFFRNAELRLPQPKAKVTIRLDREVLEYFKTKGQGYQTRINAVLRQYVRAQKRA
ncbi:MAG: BrnA antitoxin family protein [Thermodesulfobacteriota bacterium]